MAPYVIYFLSLMFSMNIAPSGESSYTVNQEFRKNVYLPEKADTAGAFTAYSSDDALRKAESIVELAKKYLGYPYVFGGTTERGFDCSGFMYFLYGKMGRPIPRMPADQWRDGINIPRSQIQKGDLIFFRGYYVGSNYIGHVGMAIDVDPKGKIYFIHAENPYTKVRIDSLTKPYYDQRFMGAARIYR